MTTNELLQARRDRMHRDAVRADEDVTRLLEKIRRAADDVEAAIQNGHRVPGSVSGRSFFAHEATDLAEAIAERQSAYERLYDFDELISDLQPHVPTPEGASLDVIERGATR